MNFAREYAERLLAIDINIEIDLMLDTGWELFNKYFNEAEISIKSELVKKYGNRKTGYISN